MTPKLSAVEVVSWLRQQAKSYIDAADAIESTLTSSVPSNGALRKIETPERQANEGFMAWSPPELTRESLLRRVRKKSARVRDLASFFRVGEDKIWEFVKTPDSGVHLAERGWIKASSDKIGEEKRS